MKLFKKKNKETMKLWDFSYANRFIKNHREDIELFELVMFNDREVKEVFIKNGNRVKVMGAEHQMGSGKIDGTIGSVHDIPSIHVIYKGGNEEWIACYWIKNELTKNFKETHCKLA